MRWNWVAPAVVALGCSAKLAPTSTTETGDGSNGASTEATSAATTDDTAADTGVMTGAESSDTTDTSGTDDTTNGTTGGSDTWQSWRLTCAFVDQIGTADSASIQAGLLSNSLGTQLADHDLNLILRTAGDPNGSGNDGLVELVSADGNSDPDLCTDQATTTGVLLGFISGADHGADPARCAEPGTSTGFEAYSVQLTADPANVFHLAGTLAGPGGGELYCADSDTTLPLYAPDVSVTLVPGEDVAHGVLGGCLLRADLDRTCSCIGPCLPQMPPGHPACGCNPDALPLSDLFLGVNDSANCTALMGAPALDYRLRFAAQRLDPQPAACP